MKTFGQYIRELRDTKDISLREFARNLKCSAAFISDVELGRRHPSDAVMASMAKVLGVSVEELQKYDTRPPIEALRRKSEADPQYAFALRRMAEQDVSGEDILKMLKRIEQKNSREGVVAALQQSQAREAKQWEFIWYAYRHRCFDQHAQGEGTELLHRFAEVQRNLSPAAKALLEKAKSAERLREALEELESLPGGKCQRCEHEEPVYHLDVAVIRHIAKAALAATDTGKEKS